MKKAIVPVVVILLSASLAAAAPAAQGGPERGSKGVKASKKTAQLLRERDRQATEARKVAREKRRQAQGR